MLSLTSLPGTFGIGDLGPAAFRWIDAMAAAKQIWWQILPVGPTGFGDSPYQSPSTFAGNLNLISPEVLRSDNLASASEISAAELPAGQIDYTAVIRAKNQLLSTAFKRFLAGDSPDLRDQFRKFRLHEKDWLDDFASFTAIKERLGGSPWWEWPKPLAVRDPDALKRFTLEFHEQIQSHRFGQFLFFRQWEQLRSQATKRGIKLLGDLPIYVADDSSDVWCHPELFLLDADHRPTHVSGVPPDYFSKTGQRWGNPLYNWDVHRKTDFNWWVKRVKAALKLFDRIRIDHFRGIEAFWAIPSSETTAEGGRWLPGPADRLLGALSTSLGKLPVVAEDLGFITPNVDELRERFHLPGMRVLQFAFGGAVEDRFLPHRFTRDLLVTTGTHDNDTTQGWYDGLTGAEREAFRAYVPDADSNPSWSLIRTAWASVAELAIAPLQDLLELGSTARLNKPGQASGNWRWRASDADVTNPRWIERLASLSQTYERTAAKSD